MRGSDHSHAKGNRCDRSAATERHRDADSSEQVSSSCSVGRITLGTSVACLVAAILVNRIWGVGYFSNDAAYFACVHDLLAAGALPYRDFFVIHTPLFYWVSGVIDQALGPDIGPPLMGFGCLLLLMWSAGWVAATAAGVMESAVTGRGDRIAAESGSRADRSSHSTARVILSAVTVGLAAAAMAGGWGRLIAFMLVGGRPKFLAVALIMFAIIAFSHRRHIIAGILLAAACWTWQVAIIETFGLVVIWAGASWRITTARRAALSLVLVVAVAAGFSALMLAILATQGNLGAFTSQVIDFPWRFAVDPWEVRGVIKPTGLARLLIPVDKGWEWIPKVLLVGSIASLVSFVYVRFRDRHLSQSPQRRLAGCCLIAVIGSGYVQVLMVAHGPGYAVPLLTPLAALSGWMVSLFPLRAGSIRRERYRAVFAAILAGSLIVASRRQPTPALADQRLAASWIKDLAGEGLILILGEPLLQALIDSPPVERLPDIQWIHGRDAFLDQRHKGGLKQYAQDLVEEQPQVIYVAERAEVIVPFLERAMDGRYVKADSGSWRPFPARSAGSKPFPDRPAGSVYVQRNPGAEP